MKRILVAAIFLSLVAIVPVFGADSGQPENANGQTFEQRQSHIMRMIDERIASLREAKTCIQAARNDDELRACKEKFMAELREQRGGMKRQRGMMDGPQGQ